MKNNHRVTTISRLISTTRARLITWSSPTVALLSLLTSRAIWDETLDCMHSDASQLAAWQGREFIKIRFISYAPASQQDEKRQLSESTMWLIVFLLCWKSYWFRCVCVLVVVVVVVVVLVLSFIWTGCAATLHSLLRDNLSSTPQLSTTTTELTNNNNNNNIHSHFSPICLWKERI